MWNPKLSDQKSGKIYTLKMLNSKIKYDKFNKVKPIITITVIDMSNLLVNNTA